MVAHETANTFSHANQAAHAFVLCDPNYSVCRPAERHKAAHFHAIAALVAYFNLEIVPILYDSDGALFPLGYFEVGLRTDRFTDPAAGTF